MKFELEVISHPAMHSNEILLCVSSRVGEVVIKSYPSGTDISVIERDVTNAFKTLFSIAEQSK